MIDSFTSSFMGDQRESVNNAMYDYASWVRMRINEPLVNTVCLERMRKVCVCMLCRGNIES